MIASEFYFLYFVDSLCFSDRVLMIYEHELSSVTHMFFFSFFAILNLLQFSKIFLAFPINSLEKIAEKGDCMCYQLIL